ncbi:MAG: ABC transporter ATP-binding protein/permease [Acetobacteraceae bacterium]|nr:ABC transporter ATP-binding protein/permease [Acetobacteraceae bacterium]
MMRVGTLLRQAWRLTLPYFMRSEQRWSARGMLLGIIVLALTQVGASALINFWYGQFYDAVQAKDLDAFIRLLLWYRWDAQHGFMLGFVPIVTPLVPLGGLQAYVQQWLQIRWRAWMTGAFLGDYMANRAYYTIGITQIAGDPGTDNPDQRISEDIRDFTSSTLDLAISFISRTTNLFSFAVILWGLSGSTEIFGITIPGYMLWGALLYAIVGTWLTHLVGRPLVPLNFLRQKAEADFRYALVRLRENGEGVALSGGETEERAVLGDRFTEVTQNWFRLMTRRFKLSLLTDTYEQAAVIFPFILGAPRYFAGAIELGGLMRIVSAFSQVQRSLSWFVAVYESLAAWSATVTRLTTFEGAIKTAHGLAAAGPTLAVGAGDGVVLGRADILLPNGQPVLQQADVTFRRGESVTISGRSGSGKSTLFRAIAGIWPFGDGRIERPRGSYLFLPQRPYVPLGTLRHAITYPGDDKAHEPAAVRQALTAAGLPALVERLDEDLPWSQILSGGEQQRLAVARALLLRPDWLFLDEATSSLDPSAENELYTALRQNLPDTTIISIAHRPDVARYHDAALTFQRKPGQAGSLVGRQAEATMESTAAP